VHNSKVIKFLVWILTRTGVVYLALWMALFATLDVRLIWGNTVVRSFNRLMPSFSDLIEYVVSGRTLTQEQWADYIRYYKRVVKLSSEDGAAYFFLGYCQTQAGQEQKAMRNFQIAVERVPGLFWFQYDLAVALYNRGNYYGAIYWFQKAVDFGPERMMHYMYDSKLYRQVIGRAYEMGHNVDLEMAQAFQRSHLLVAKSWYLLGEYDKALSMVQYGLSEGFGRDKDFYLIAALSLKELKRYSKAASVLRSYLETYPGDINALNEMEGLLLLTDRRDAAQGIRGIKEAVSERFGFQAEDLFHKENYRLF